jgi:TolB-like protein/Flp pilus assembly protein TadD
MRRPPTACQGVVPSVTEPSHAVFLSYASQDAEAAHRICEALRAAGIEVFFDQSELRGGDAWDQKIRHEIHDCALFIPMVSQHTQERLEGYFRHEWKLAIERTHHIAEQKAFLVPVVIDGTRDQEAVVPDAFRHVQWTRLPAGETPPEFVTRIQKLLSGESGPLPTMARGPATVTARRSSRLKPAVLAVVLGAVAAYLLVEKPWTAKPVAFAPPPHSIAVLPFVNMSGDKEQEYFSDGLTEEILNSLARINELQVAARTSAFSFKGKDTDIGAISRQLNVAAVLEGSVRRSAKTIRVTAQLVNSVSGFHLWSQTYDRDLGDVLALQSDIATAVASALKVTLLGNTAGKVELGGTRNPAAFDAYLRGWKIFYEARKPSEIQAAIDLHSRAIDLDPKYALACAARAFALANYAADLVNYAEPKTFASALAARDVALTKALEDAHEAIALAPGLGEGYSALGLASANGLELGRADAALERSLALAPGNARVLRIYGFVIAPLGRVDRAITTGRQALLLDPVNVESGYNLAGALFYARRYAESLATLQKFGAADPEWGEINANRGIVYYALGNYDAARTACELDTSDVLNLVCLAITYDKIGRKTDAKAMLKKLQTASGDAALYQYARIYVQWGNGAKALEYLDSALRFRHSDLLYLKMDPLLDPIRREPRFQAIERALKFPD